jgi:murein DD-endopeptidase MepM/ murein hydrolase activator NlpD
MLTQPFGTNWLDFYKKMNMKGHNGLDFYILDNPKVYATHSGTVIQAGMDGDGGIGVEIITDNEGEGFKTVYYHLKEVDVKMGDKISVRQTIGLADNTGKYTTGGHLHFGLKRTVNGRTIDYNNGYFGAVDPTPYFIKDWNLTPAAKRYDRIRTWEYYQMEIKVAASLTRYLKRLPSYEQINACVYGYWDRESVANPAMAFLWKYLTKIQYQAGRRPFT